MSPRQVERETAIPHPRETSLLFGHREAETALLTAYSSGRIPHAWLIGGPQGIGKATLAYRMARFVLAHGQPLAPTVQRAETLMVDPNDAVLREAAEASEGSVARALTLLGGDALKFQQRTAALLARLPQVDPRELHTLGDSLGTSDRVALAAFIDGIDRWIAERLHADEANANQNLPRLARLAEVWEKIVRAARDTETYNLERKPLVFSVFGWLADATR